MKKAGKDERVWLVLRNIILLCGLIPILFPLWLVLIQFLQNAGRGRKKFLCTSVQIEF